MTNKRNDAQAKKSSGFLAWVEKVGNSLPHPTMIFVILIAILAVVAQICYLNGVSVEFFDAKEGQNVTIEAIPLLNADGIRHIFQTAVTNFTGFAPLGTVLVTMLGVGVAEYSGFFDAGLKKLLSNVPSVVLTATVVFVGVLSSIATDAGYVVVVPLGAMIFLSAGKHPLAGLAAAFAGVSGGFSANLLFGPTDAILSGLTNESLSAANIDVVTDIAGNWYFIIASTFFLTIVGTLVTELVVIPNLGTYKNTEVDNTGSQITELEKKGLNRAVIGLLIYAVILGFLMFPENAILKEADSAGEVNLTNFLFHGLIPALFLLFLIPGYIYGKTVGTIKDTTQLVEAMTDSMQAMGGYIVLAFFASQFIALFSYTNLGTILSVNGANFLNSVGLKGIPLIILFIILTGFLNLFIGSASAKWAIMAPIFVPMFFELGLSPELTQMAYRIADSSTNIISPLMSYFAMVVVFMQKYDKDSGLGTLISTMLPYSIAFLIFWTILLIIWILLGLPLGPGAGLYV